MPAVYIAGPMVFRVDAAEVYADLRASCHELGLDALTPIDGTLDLSLPKHDLARIIKQANMALIRRCDGVIACISPFRGPGADAGTAWEMGYAEALAKPVVAWSETAGFYAPRATVQRSRRGEILDGDGLIVEDFDLADNLMLTADVPVTVDFTAAVRIMAARLAQSDR